MSIDNDTDDIDDLDGGVDATGEDPDVPLTRDERRRQRPKLMQENATLRQQVLELQRAQAEQQGYLRAQMEQQRAGQQQSSALEEVDAKIRGTYQLEANLRQEVRLLEQEYAAKRMPVPQERMDAIYARGQALEVARGELIADKAMMKRGVRPSDPADTARAMLEQEHGDVMRHPKALPWANLEYSKRTLEGAAPGKRLLESVMADARKKYGLSQDAREDSRFSGPTGGAGGGDGAGGQAPAPMSDADKEMAFAMYPSIDPKEAVRLYKKKFMAKGS